jgi:hypothetical protein
VGLEDDPFSWQIPEDGRVSVFRDGRQVAIIAGAQADRLRPKLANAPDEAQHTLARVTGDHQSGNERRGSQPQLGCTAHEGVVDLQQVPEVPGVGSVAPELVGRVLVEQTSPPLCDLALRDLEGDHAV